MKQAEWWRGAAIYPIYPRSFVDSNGDGVGDLQGITSRLDYVAALGVDGIWLSPFFPSPMRDFGYDVCNHCDVDPIFGTLADFDALLARAHALGLRVIIDQVWSHTAKEHPWFEESRSSRDNAKADWYVWAGGRPDGTPPTNWQSWMGGPTWTWDPRRRQYYLHNFLPEMPDLNFHSRAVQDAILDVGRFWLERGVDGFRLDTANYYCHDRLLRDNPAQAAGQHSDQPAAMQQHLFNICQPETLPFLARVRQLTDRFDARFTVAEIGSANNLARMIEYTRGEQRLHRAYSFVLLGNSPDPTTLAELIQPWQQGEGVLAWPSWAMSNHDVPRVATRWAQGDPQRAKQWLALLAVLRGTIFLYQGEELGLTQSDIAFAQLQDPFGKAHWPRNMGRDGCRTPMPWHADAAHAEFSTGTPWLPVDAQHQARAVNLQEVEPGSCLTFTRRLLALRNSQAALRIGRLDILASKGQVLALRRAHETQGVLAAFNFSSEPCALTLPELAASQASLLCVGQAEVQSQTLRLGPWAALIALA